MEHTLLQGPGHRLRAPLKARGAGGAGPITPRPRAAGGAVCLAGPGPSPHGPGLQGELFVWQGQAHHPAAPGCGGSCLFRSLKQTTSIWLGFRAASGLHSFLI